MNFVTMNCNNAHLIEANTKLEELYTIHDTVFNLGKKEKSEKMDSIIREIETIMIAAGFQKQLNILQAPTNDITEEKTTSPSQQTSLTTAKLSSAAPGTASTNTSTNNKSAKVLAYYIFGKALDAREGYSDRAEKFLSKAVKLAPNDVDAWNALANCFWKKGDLKQALQCFQSALEERENVHSLRELSILRRQLGGSNDEMVQNMVKSLGEAKKAIALDVSNQKSWYVLGNAHLAQFFQMQHDPVDLSKALKAYQRALGNKKNGATTSSSATNSSATTNEKIDTTDSNNQSSNPDLYFNRATVHKYLENYNQAIEDFKAAHTVDPELPAMNMIAYIERSCLKIQKHIKSHCRLKPKRVSAIASSILTSSHHQAVVGSLSAQKQAQSQKENSEKENGISSSDSTKLPPVLEVATVSSLQNGKNVGKIVPLKLLMPVVHETHDPPA